MKFVRTGPRKDYCPYCKGELDSAKRETIAVDHRVMHRDCRDEHYGVKSVPRRKRR